MHRCTSVPLAVAWAVVLLVGAATLVASQPLHDAAAEGDLDRVLVLLDRPGVDVNQANTGVRAGEVFGSGLELAVRPLIAFRPVLLSRRRLEPPAGGGGSALRGRMQSAS